jgi:rfaE bifunctional protein nucleotidyltransferase chain/domain/rfaE bifunctional protein kinase chain/domain
VSRQDPRIVVVGDLLLDRDVHGRVDRLCPDAPAPVLDVSRETTRPGAAGLVAVLLARAGFRVDLVSPVACDDAADRLRRSLAAAEVRLAPLPARGPTRQKVRLLAGDRVLARLDHGGSTAPPTDVGELGDVLRGAAAVLVADYGGGTTAHPDVRAALATAARAVPTVWDPHPRGAEPVAGVLVATPNLGEACAVLGVDRPADDAQIAGARAVGDALVARWPVRAVAVTLGPHGALLSHGDGPPFVVPARPAAGDTCGAGDALAAGLTAGLAQGALLDEALVRAVDDAADFVAAGGAATLGVPAGTPTEAAPRRGVVVATGGCFDLLHVGHVALLESARRLGDRLVVLVNSDESVRRLKGPGRPLTPCADRVRVLEALASVDEVRVFDEDRPDAALRALRPDVWAKGGDYTELPEAATVAEWGGQCVTLPYVDGRSTTRLIDLNRSVPTKTKESR